METLTFTTSAQFMQWVERIVKSKDPGYDRVPVGKQTWTYGDGYVSEGEMGKRGGTVLSNLSYTLRTGTGKMAHSRDARVVNDIDARGGVVITINWGE